MISKIMQGNHVLITLKLGVNQEVIVLTNAILKDH